MEVNIERLIKFSLSIEGYFICYCLYNEKEDELLRYITKVNKIPSNVFDQLIGGEWITYSGKDGKYTVDNIELTERFSRDILMIIPHKNMSFDECFQQLREHYPIIAGNSGRRLHGDLARCINLYKTTIVKNGRINDELHSVILQCVNFEINLRTKNKSLDYFQLLATWLSQKTWELYKDDVENLIKKNGFVDKNRDNDGNKTQLGSEDF